MEVAGETVLVIRRTGMLKLATALIDGTVRTDAARLWQRGDDNPYKAWSGLTLSAGILRAQIERGELAPRRPVPSKRTLRETYGIAGGTVDKAMGLLRADQHDELPGPLPLPPVGQECLPLLEACVPCRDPQNFGFTHSPGSRNPWEPIGTGFADAARNCPQRPSVKGKSDLRVR
jgi:Bacterial regulatory proteins, gntR family